MKVADMASSVPR